MKLKLGLSSGRAGRGVRIYVLWYDDYVWIDSLVWED
jgi:hypothetical protein